MKQKRIIFSLVIAILIFLFVPLGSYATTENLNIYSPSVILMEPNTGKILYEKNAYERRYPASTTKIMTAILALEHYQDLSVKATVSYHAIFSVPSRICKCKFTVRRRTYN